MVSKYHAQPVERDGIRFASRAEARRYEDLRVMQMAGEIQKLVCHPRFALYAPTLREDAEPINQEHPWKWLQLCRGEYGPNCVARRIGYYTADFAYETKDGVPVVEDVKGGNATRTEAYRLRKRIVEAIYGIEIREVHS